MTNKTNIQALGWLGYFAGFGVRGRKNCTHIRAGCKEKGQIMKNLSSISGLLCPGRVYFLPKSRSSCLSKTSFLRADDFRQFF